MYWFCHTSTWIHHRCTRVPHPERLSSLPPHTIPLGHPSAPAPSFLYPASNLDWRFISYVILYMFQCHSPKSSPTPSPPESKRLFYTFVSLLLCLWLESMQCLRSLDYSSFLLGKNIFPVNVRVTLHIPEYAIKNTFISYLRCLVQIFLKDRKHVKSKNFWKIAKCYNPTCHNHIAV